jgi:hypothetical protein
MMSVSKKLQGSVASGERCGVRPPQPLFYPQRPVLRQPWARPPAGLIPRLKRYAFYFSTYLNPGFKKMN